MTLIVAWIGVDDKKKGKSIASMYFASDSRFSWRDGSKYDNGVKLFGSNRHPEIFGFCGDVLIPNLLLAQLIPQINSGLLLSDNHNIEEKSKIIESFINSSIKQYPGKYSKEPFTILYGTRYQKEFGLYRISNSKNGEIKMFPIDLPRQSMRVYSGGSGKNEFEENYKNWERERHNNYRTSRGVYHCVSSTINTLKDWQTGGVPQIIGLYRIGEARIFGVVQNGRRFVLGKESYEDITSEKIEWRNSNFERIDPEKMILLDGAQRQPI